VQRLKVIGVDIFLEKRRTRQQVGTLTRENDQFVFTYVDSYFRSKQAFPLGPEFPLTQQQFTSDKLFPSFLDRIPSRVNPAYADYCYAMGISVDEEDPLVLLSTIGRRGPSSFMFHPIYESSVSAETLTQFRNALELTSREFAAVFEFSQTSLNALEKGRISGSEVSKRLEIILSHPDVALELLRRNSGHLTHEKWVKASHVLKALIQ
jgi:HipA-like protein